MWLLAIVVVRMCPPSRRTSWFFGEWLFGEKTNLSIRRTMQKKATLTYDYPAVNALSGWQIDQF
jgi:hypothetical protein